MDNSVLNSYDTIEGTEKIRVDITYEFMNQQNKRTLTLSGQSYNTVCKAFALYAADWVSLLVFHLVPKLARSNSEHKARSSPWAVPDGALKQKNEKDRFNTFHFYALN